MRMSRRTSQPTDGSETGCPGGSIRLVRRGPARPLANSNVAICPQRCRSRPLPGVPGGSGDGTSPECGERKAHPLCSARGSFGKRGARELTLANNRQQSAKPQFLVVWDRNRDRRVLSPPLQDDWLPLCLTLEKPCLSKIRQACSPERRGSLGNAHLQR